MVKPDAQGSKPCITRRNLLRGGVALIGLGACAGLGPVIRPERADALTMPVEFVVGHEIGYAGAVTHEFTVNGSIAFCVNPQNYAPPTGSYDKVHDDVTWDSAGARGEQPNIDLNYLRGQLRKTLYYGVDGPGYDPSFFPSTWYDGTPMTRDRMIACEHVFLSDLYALQFYTAVSGAGANFISWCQRYVTGVVAGDDGIWDDLTPEGMRYKLDQRALPPDTFKAYVMEAGYDSAHSRNYQRIMFFEASQDVTVEKRWAGSLDPSPYMPDSITVRLNGSDGSERTLTLSEATGWSGKFLGLPVDVDYTLSEDPVPKFDTTISGNASSGFTVTNTLQTGYGKALKEARNKSWL